MAKDTDRANLLFVLSLGSASRLVRAEASGELMLPVLENDPAFAGEILKLINAKKTTEFDSLKAACYYRLGRFPDLANLKNSTGGADKILALLGRLKTSKKGDSDLRRELADFFFTNPVDAVWQWALDELEQQDGDCLSPAETEALAGRKAVIRLDYRQGVLHFRTVLETGSGLFLRYPELITDIGRSFQYTLPAREEGARLFRQWDEFLENAPLPLTKDEGQNLRYRLLYYAGRIARQREQYRESGEYFARALDLAPDHLQSDACIWYMLMNALSAQSSNAAKLVMETMPRWNSAPYFADAMDRLSQQLVSQRQWATLLELYNTMKGERAHGAILAQYAWILGRAVQEGYLKETEAGDADAFFRTAFEEGNASIYYRVLAASRLGARFIPTGESAIGQAESKNRGTEKINPELEFLLGFFEFGGGKLISPYIRKFEKNLGYPELRILAKALAEADRLDESISLVSRYMAREDYKISHADLELFYPRHFLELIEKNARDAGLEPELLFGLVRTESSFMPQAVSRSGAVGLTQLMEPTAMDMAGRIARRGGPDYRAEGTIDLKDPEANVHIGTFYLNYLIDQMGSPMMALLAYNGGMGRLRRWRAGDRQTGNLPEDAFLESIEYTETREYGRRVLGAAAVYGFLYYNKSMEAVVADIYR
ncbi:transglycosylase SLT domain protein [Leadbettera azotonutricia ZAS-9]|uniref:Transglycosylase SLT domain protein n=1 Tax=Leadbettera azotonutricia (strain ATCC BAA-888 / DSM 13862 / ZAS-9) TaxID=545695 RepID=F5YCF1_LEAAZ|nr:lytic transglycosylase domain-containing protein [Leadbettera azotonutricia]AEF82960.1 transglycosylase SLT domain protein [Leadbettera azotonutricia ZAS-9]